jgi:hypothetical protein
MNKPLILRSIKRFLSAALVSCLCSCAPSPFDLSDHTHIYHDGQLALFTDQDNCFLSITGEINPQLEKLVRENVAELSAKNCHQRVVLLQSHGGDVNTAMVIGQMIRAHKLTTHIHSYCDSACGFVFIGGVSRTVSMEASSEAESALGFHQPKPMDGLRQCLNQAQINPILLANIKSYLREMLSKEAADAYYQELMNAPCKGMDYLNANFMLEKGIATSVEW